MTDDRYCKHCAEAIDPSMSYCPSCGSRIVWVDETRTPDLVMPSPGKPGPYTPPQPAMLSREDMEREQKKADAIASLKRDWWKTLIALIVVLYFFFAWIT